MSLSLFVDFAKTVPDQSPCVANEEVDVAASYPPGYSEKVWCQGSIMACSGTEIQGVIVKYQYVRDVLVQLETLIRGAVPKSEIVNVTPFSSEGGSDLR